jgi:hypothetical protein
VSPVTVSEKETWKSRVAALVGDAGAATVAIGGVLSIMTSLALLSAVGPIAIPETEFELRASLKVPTEQSFAVAV